MYCYYANAESSGVNLRTINLILMAILLSEYQLASNLCCFFVYDEKHYFLIFLPFCMFNFGFEVIFLAENQKRLTAEISAFMFAFNLQICSNKHLFFFKPYKQLTFKQFAQ